MILQNLGDIHLALIPRPAAPPAQRLQLHHHALLLGRLRVWIQFLPPEDFIPLFRRAGPILVGGARGAAGEVKRVDDV